MSEILDSEIINAIKQGRDTRVLNFLYERALPKVKNYILSNSGSLDDVKDVFQDAVIAFYKSVQTGKFDKNRDIDGFIFTAARNNWINIAKVKSRSTSIDNVKEEAHGDQNAHQGIEHREKSRLINQVFKQLDQNCQRLLTLTIFNKVPMVEIAYEMGFSDERVARVSNHRCKQKLAKLLKGIKEF